MTKSVKIIHNHYLTFLSEISILFIEVCHICDFNRQINWKK